MFDSIDRDKILLELNRLRLKYLAETRHRFSEGARKHLHRGLLVRINMLEESVVVLDDELGRADGPLDSYLATKLTLLINAYYLNLAGSLDNLAWAIVYHHFLWAPIDENDRKQRRNAHLMGREFLDAISAKGLANLKHRLCSLKDWYWEMRELRDPAAHRIPITVPPAIYSESDIQEMQRLDSESANAIEKGDRNEARAAFHKSNSLGRQMPVFISESTSMHFYDLAARVNEDHVNWHKIVKVLLDEGFN
jgi:hypothetical protein